MRQTFGQYHQSVELYIDDITGGEVGLSDLADFADGDASIGDCYATGVTPRQCAVNILNANAYPLASDGRRI